VSRRESMARRKVGYNRGEDRKEEL